MDNCGEEGKRVCVTGASGYIASWIVKRLLERGYTVNATVRSLNDQKKIEHLLALEGAKERLHLFEASLLKQGSFDSAFQGCHGVFHTASPILGETTNPQEEIIDPAVKGTLNVLSSCAKNPSVKRVVLTSSMAAVVFNGTPLTPEVVVDETWFTVPEFCEHARMKWYQLSKTLAEEAAWKFVKENGMDMVTINPSFVLGPVLQSTLSSSPALFLSSLYGAGTYQSAKAWVHVKDVADAHILAFETPSANGRYLLAESVAYMSEVFNILHELFPTLKLPHKCENDKPLEPPFKVSKEKVESLGINYIPLRTALKETIECFKEKNFISF